MKVQSQIHSEGGPSEGSRGIGLVYEKTGPRVSGDVKRTVLCRKDMK